MKRFSWRGAVVEANPKTFELLQRNYKKYPGVEAINTAVSNFSGSLDLWCPRGVIRGLQMEETSEGCTTIQRLAIWNETYHFTTPVMTPTELWAKLRPASVDMLVIDVEGAEAAILSRPLPEPKPRAILFESTTFGSEDGRDSLRQVHAALGAQGYRHVGQVGWDSAIKCVKGKGCHDELWVRRSMVGLALEPSPAENAALFQLRNSSSPCALTQAAG